MIIDRHYPDARNSGGAPPLLIIEKVTSYLYLSGATPMSRRI
jgi:hypothetical protein